VPPASILIVDDNAQNLYLARFLLEKEGHVIHQANNGEDAVALANTENFDLILMDIQMPGMDGLEATRLIKGLEKAPPVIALTAKVMSGDRETILAAGCDGYIQKPIDPQNFPANIKQHLQHIK